MEKVLWLTKYVRSGVRSFMHSQTSWSWQQSNQDINWEQSALNYAGDSRHTQNIQINEVTGENKKCVFYFMEKNKRIFGQLFEFTVQASGAICWWKVEAAVFPIFQSINTSTFIQSVTFLWCEQIF